MMNRRFVFVRAAIVAALTSMSGASFALDLMGSYEKALSVDPDLLAADQAVLAGREKAVQGRALMRPQVALTASYSHVNEKSSTSLPPQLADIVKSKGSGQVHQAALQLTQPIYDAKSRSDKKQLQQQSDLAEVSHRNAQQDLMQRVSEAYFNVLLAQENLRVAQAEKGAVSMQRDRAKARFDVGRGKITEVQETQARHDSVLAKEVSAQSTLALRQAQYQELTGVPAIGLADLRVGFVPAPPQPDNLQAWQLKGLEQNAGVLAKRGELAIATFEISKYRLERRPTIDLVASYTHEGQNGGLSPTVSPDSSRAGVIGLQLNVPLYTGGAISSKQREAVAKKGQAEQELSAAQRDARLQVQDAYLAVKTGVARIAALEQSLLSAQTALEATTLGRDVGTRTELDVLDAQQRVYSTQLELAQARNEYLIGRIRLAYAAGELGESDLRGLNAYLAS
jgi:outer membrane protein